MSEPQQSLPEPANAAEGPPGDLHGLRALIAQRLKIEGVLRTETPFLPQFQ